jgi:hypothetical protein
MFLKQRWVAMTLRALTVIANVETSGITARLGLLSGAEILISVWSLTTLAKFCHPSHDMTGEAVLRRIVRRCGSSRNPGSSRAAPKRAGFQFIQMLACAIQGDMKSLQLQEARVLCASHGLNASGTFLIK